MISHQKLEVTTSHSQEFVEITRRVEAAVRAAGTREGFVRIFCPHTTAGLTINENADPDVVTDMLAGLERLVPVEGNYRHVEGNAHAHIKASLMGFDLTVPVSRGALLLGTWQGIYFCEFDGPRRRTVTLSIEETEERI